jgi:hypothetical protein
MILSRSRCAQRRVRDHEYCGHRSHQSRARARCSAHCRRLEEPITAIKGLLPIARGMLEPAPGEEINPKGATDILHAILLLTEKLESDRTEVLRRLLFERPAA